jgi:hypothetical protein
MGLPQLKRCMQVLLPKRQGGLKKRKERKGVFSDWNHRFFVLQDKFLFYYDCDGRNARGTVTHAKSAMHATLASSAG